MFRNHGMHHLVNYIQRSDHASLLILCYVEIKPAHWHTGTSRCDAFYFNAWSLLMYSDHACIAEHVFYWLCILYLETRQCTSVQIKLIRVLLTFYLEIKPCIGYRSCVLLATYCITTDQTMNFVCDAGIRLCTEIKVHPVTWWRYISVHGLISLCSQFYSCAIICYSLIDACFIHGSKPKLSSKHVLWSDHGSSKMLCLEIRLCFEIRFLCSLIGVFWSDICSPNISSVRIGRQGAGNACVFLMSTQHCITHHHHCCILEEFRTEVKHTWEKQNICMSHTADYELTSSGWCPCTDGDHHQW